MNGVKGLVLKEVYLRRKTFLSGITVFILLFILSVSFCLSLDYGNLKDHDPSTAVILSYAVAGMGIMLFSQNSETITKDAKCKWNVFERTLPLSAQKLAAVRIGTVLAQNLLGTVICAGLGAVIFVLAHQRLTVSFFANIAAVALIIFFAAILSNFMFLKYKDPQKAATRFMVLIFGIYVTAALFIRSEYAKIRDQFAEITEEELDKLLMEKYIVPIAEWRDRLFPFAALFFAALTVAGYFLFLAQYKRREK